MTSQQVDKLNLEIEGLLFDLTDLSIYRFETQEAAVEAYAAVTEYKEVAMLAIEELINRQVTAVLEELEQQSRVASMCTSDTYVVKSKVIQSIKERYE